MRYLCSDTVNAYISDNLNYIKAHIVNQTKIDQAFADGYELAYKHILEIIDIVPGEEVVPF